MKHLASILVGLALLCTFAEAHAVPATVSFTGRLTTSTGPVDGAVALRFSLYDQAIEGAEVWSETRPSVTATAGLVYVDLGALTTLDDAVLADDALYLEIRVGNEILTPRLALQSVPYAIRAEVADRAALLGTIAPADVVTSVIGGGGVTVSRSGNTITLGSTLQPRVTGTCGPNAAIASVSATGTVTCETDNDTTYSGGAGISVAGTTIGLTACTAGQVLKAGAAGTWTCAADVDTNTTYVGGSGVTLTGSSFATDNTVVARKDAAAGDQLFANRIGLGVAMPRERLDVAGPIRFEGVRLFRKFGNNGTAPCNLFCESPLWAGGKGACLAAKINGGAYVSCAAQPNQDLSCLCAGIDE